MWTFYKKHLTYKNADEKDLKKQIADAYHVGMSGKEKNEPIEAAKTKTVTNINSLNRTLEMFADLNPSRSLVRLSREKLDQEQKWLAHYEKCIEQTKRGYAQLKINAKGLEEEAFAAGKADMEKHIKARVQEERAVAARLQAELAEKQRLEREKNKNNNDRDRNRDNNDRDRNRDRDNNNNKGDRRVNVVIEKMVLKEEDKGKKKEGKKVKVFHQLKD